MKAGRRPSFQHFDENLVARFERIVHREMKRDHRVLLAIPIGA